MVHFGNPGRVAEPSSNFLKIEIVHPRTLYFDALNPLVTYLKLFICDILVFAKMVRFAIICSSTDPISYMASLGGQISSKGWSMVSYHNFRGKWSRICHKIKNFGFLDYPSLRHCVTHLRPPRELKFVKASPKLFSGVCATRPTTHSDTAWFGFDLVPSSSLATGQPASYSRTSKSRR